MKPAIVILSFFAALWYLWGLSAVSPVPVAALAPCLISVGFPILAFRLPKPPPVPGVGRVVGWVSAAEGVAILAAANGLNWAGLAAYFPCAVAAIVGLHFLPIARVLRFRPYYIGAAAMLAAAIGACAIGNPATRQLAVCAAAALILWAMCAAVLQRAPRPAAARA